MENMENLATFKALLKQDSNLAEQFLVETYGMSAFQAFFFVQRLPDDVTLAYTFGALDELRGLAGAVTDQLKEWQLV